MCHFVYKRIKVIVVAVGGVCHRDKRGRERNDTAVRVASALCTERIVEYDRTIKRLLLNRIRTLDTLGYPALRVYGRLFSICQLSSRLYRAVIIVYSNSAIPIVYPRLFFGTPRWRS